MKEFVSPEQPVTPTTIRSIKNETLRLLGEEGNIKRHLFRVGSPPDNTAIKLIHARCIQDERIIEIIFAQKELAVDKGAPIPKSYVKIIDLKLKETKDNWTLESYGTKKIEKDTLPDVPKISMQAKETEAEIVLDALKLVDPDDEFIGEKITITDKEIRKQILEDKTSFFAAAEQVPDSIIDDKNFIGAGIKLDPMTTVAVLKYKEDNDESEIVINIYKICADSAITTQYLSNSSEPLIVQIFESKKPEEETPLIYADEEQTTEALHYLQAALKAMIAHKRNQED